jgi:hypothetical protein
MILRSKGRGEATAKTNIGRAGVGAERKQERVEIMRKTGTKGAEVEKETEIEIGETGAEAERGTGVTAGKREEGQEIGVLVPVMTKEGAIQEKEAHCNPDRPTSLLELQGSLAEEVGTVSPLQRSGK